MKVIGLMERQKVSKVIRGKLEQKIKFMLMEYMSNKHTYQYQNYSFDIGEDTFELFIHFNDFKFYWYGDDILFTDVRKESFQTYSLDKFIKLYKSVEKIIEKILEFDSEDEL